MAKMNNTRKAKMLVKRKQFVYIHNPLATVYISKYLHATTRTYVTYEGKHIICHRFFLAICLCLKYVRSRRHHGWHRARKF